VQRTSVLIDASGDGTQELLAYLVASGCAPVAKCTVASWSCTTSAQRVLAQWAAMHSAGSPLDSLLRGWARREFVDLNRLETSEHYTLEGVQLTWATAVGGTPPALSA
jgi:hypothetical protein